MPHPIVRFAPSPTGRIHIGNARTTLLNFLYARKNHGEFILRFNDTDVEPSKEEFAQAIEVDLAWLGIAPDAVLRQSQRFALYHAAAGKLREERTTPFTCGCHASVAIHASPLQSAEWMFLGVAPLISCFWKS